MRSVGPESGSYGALGKCSHLCVELARKELLGLYLFAHYAHLLAWLLWFILWLARRRVIARTYNRVRERCVRRDRLRASKAERRAIRERILQRRAAKRERKRARAWRHTSKPKFLVQWQRPRRLPCAAGSQAQAPRGLRLLGSVVMTVLLHMLCEQAGHAAQQALRWNWRAATWW